MKKNHSLNKYLLSMHSVGGSAPVVQARISLPCSAMLSYLVSTVSTSALCRVFLQQPEWSFKRLNQSSHSLCSQSCDSCPAYFQWNSKYWPSLARPCGSGSWPHLWSHFHPASLLQPCRPLSSCRYPSKFLTQDFCPYSSLCWNALSLCLCVTCSPISCRSLCPATLSERHFLSPLSKVYHLSLCLPLSPHFTSLLLSIYLVIVHCLCL